MKLLSESITRKIGKAGLHLKEASPHIFFGLGVVGVVGAGVLACRATLKAEEKVDKIREDIDNVQKLRASALETEKATGIKPRYTEADYHKDLGYVGMNGAVELGKLYGPSILLGAVSIGALAGAHIQLTRRNTALTVTLAAVTKAYNEYRSRVRGVLGDERELAIYQGSREVEVVTEDGRIKVETQYDPNARSIYARLYDETTTRYWEKNATLNAMHVMGVLNQCQNILISRGHIFLNEVYDQLGLERSTAGQIVGWYWKGDGDNFIDFGLDTPAARDFVEGHERSVWLDFNVDGPIHTKIE